MGNITQFANGVLTVYGNPSKRVEAPKPVAAKVEQQPATAPAPKTVKPSITKPAIDLSAPVAAAPKAEATPVVEQESKPAETAQEDTVAPKPATTKKAAAK